ncbi:MAG TPA: hypothetical protein PK359_16720, partial [Burkholderiaceae bacterium]|nr:hypothetical protein [Burkholderiaceae bacterium]
MRDLDGADAHGCRQGIARRLVDGAGRDAGCVPCRDTGPAARRSAGSGVFRCPFRSPVYCDRSGEGRGADPWRVHGSFGGAAGHTVGHLATGVAAKRFVRARSGCTAARP